MAYPQSIPFHGQTIPVFTQNRQHYVAMKPICENIGLDWRAQRQRIMRNSVMANKKPSACRWNTSTAGCSASMPAA